MMRLVTDDIDTEPMALPSVVAAADDAALDAGFPGEVEMILSAMDAATPHPAAAQPGVDRRTANRRPHRAKANLRLYAHDPAEPAMELFTRDVSATGVGFITRQRLPLGYNGLVRIALDGGEIVTAACSVYRCRQSIDGWYEGALHFMTRQPELA